MRLAEALAPLNVKWHTAQVDSSSGSSYVIDSDVAGAVGVTTGTAGSPTASSNLLQTHTTHTLN